MGITFATLNDDGNWPYRNDMFIKIAIGSVSFLAQYFITLMGISSILSAAVDSSAPIILSTSRTSTGLRKKRLTWLILQIL